jgi:hypothetical protein
MKTILIAFAALLLFVSNPTTVCASDSGRKPTGFNYAKHARKNQKAAKFSKKRMRAAKGNMVNVKCNSRQTARYARSNR